MTDVVIADLEFDEIMAYDLDHIDVPSDKLISVSKESLDLAFDGDVIITKFDSGFYYSSTSHYSLPLSSRNNDLTKIKIFLNYYRFDPFTIVHNGKSHVAYLDYTSNTIQALDIYNSSPGIFIDFVVIS